jgi:soluble lytic murein transglycosylase
VVHTGARDTLILASVVATLVAIEPARPLANRPADIALAPIATTAHPPVARDAAQLWMAPSTTDRENAAANPAHVHFQAALRMYADEQYEQALARFVAAASGKSALHAHASYYAGVAELRLRRFESARKRFAALKGTEGFVGRAAALGEAEAAQEMGDHDAAVDIYEDLLEGEAAPGGDEAAAIWLSLANAAQASDDPSRAAEAYLHLYYEFPLSEFAARAQRPLETLPQVQPVAAGNARYKLELGRGERLFGSRRYADARASFQRLQPHATGDDADLVSLRLAEIDQLQSRHRQAQDALRRHMSSGPRQAEARFFYLMADRGLKKYDAFAQQARALARDFPRNSWGEEALNHLATYYIQQDRDDDADQVFREMSADFPRGRYAERAAWKVGWLAYRKGMPADTIRYFESASVSFPRSDYRPNWLYWSARARDISGDRAGAIERYQLTLADYQNTYYGRLADAILKKYGEAPRAGTLVFSGQSRQAAQAKAGPFPPTEPAIRTLLALGLYEPAVKELEYARARWGDSPAITASIAWAQKQMAASESGNRQFTLARGSITLMRRAYPQFMARGGEQLPREILTTIFPLSYWDLIKKYSAQNDLDPYLVAALMAQESTFVRDISSHANATGLMQLMAPTARQYAKRFGVRYTARLRTDPEFSIRAGTAYVSEKIKEFGSVHLGLASYNAGETAVRRWIRERPPDLPQDEFIDDIPYPETQQYVKRLLGTAEDYRRLYALN